MPWYTWTFSGAGVAVVVLLLSALTKLRSERVRAQGRSRRFQNEVRLRGALAILFVSGSIAVMYAILATQVSLPLAVDSFTILLTLFASLWTTIDVSRSRANTDRRTSTANATNATAGRDIRVIVNEAFDEALRGEDGD